MREAWTYEELDKMQRSVQKEKNSIEAEHPDIRPLPPLSEDEAMALIRRLIDSASEHSLSLDECFFFGQLLTQYRMAVEARMLGKEGRYFVVSEDDISRLGGQKT